MTEFVIEFELTQDHITLLRAMNFEHNLDLEWPGSPTVDCKRPFGNSGHGAIRDMSEILDRDVPDYDDEAYNKWKQEIEEIWSETATALNVILSAESFKPGLYVKKIGYGRWKRK